MRFWRLLVAVAVVSAAARSTVGLDRLSPTAWSVLQLGPLVVVAVGGLVGQRQQRPVQPFTVTLWLLVAWAAASALWSDDPGAVLFQAATLGLMVAAVLATISRRWTTRERLLADLRWLGWLLVAMHAVGLVAHYIGAPWAIPEYDRYRGLYTNANYAGTTAAVAFMALLTTRRRLVDVAGMLVAGGALLASGSRGALVAVIFGVVVTAVLPATRARIVVYAWAGALAVVASSILGLGLTGFVSGFFDRVRESSDLSSGRFDIYRLFIEQWRESPILGIGYQQSAITEGSIGTARGTYTVLGHSTYLSTLVELGVLGLGLFLAALIACWRQARRRDPLVALFVTVLVCELTESILFGIANASAMVEWLALAAYAASAVPSGRDDPLDSGGNAVDDLPSVTRAQR